MKHSDLCPLGCIAVPPLQSLLSLCFGSSSPCERTSGSRVGSSPGRGLHPSSCEGCLVSLAEEHRNITSLWGCFSTHLHTHMGMPPAPGHESWSQGLPPPCQGEFSEDAGKSCTLLGQHRPFLLMENCVRSCNTDQSGRLSGLQATLSHFMPGHVTAHTCSS